eukprot:scaffold11152_cov119-Isochrysis_galbana.AAC.2
MNLCVMVMCVHTAPPTCNTLPPTATHRHGKINITPRVSPASVRRLAGCLSTLVTLIPSAHRAADGTSLPHRPAKGKAALPFHCPFASPPSLSLYSCAAPSPAPRH